MAQQSIGIGAAPDDGTGDTLRAGFGKCNDNFTELYADKADTSAVAELARDAVGTALTAGALITITPSDGADTITIAVDTAGVDERARDAIGTALTAGTGMTVTPSDVGDTITIAVDTTTEAERIRDVIGAALVAGTNITLTVNDAGDTITIAASGGGGSGGEPAAVTGTPGTGAATPTTPAKGFPMIGRLRVGMCGLFRFDDGSAWELRWGFYNGTTVSRPTAGFVASSSGSGLTLTSAATVTLIQEAGETARSGGHIIALQGVLGGNVTATGTGAAGTGFFQNATATSTHADTNLLTREPKSAYTSATTANANCGIEGANDETSRNTGFDFSCRFGAGQLPTGPRLHVGLDASNATLAADPSAKTNLASFAKDSADTNIQFMVNDAAGTATKTDTSIALAIDKLYQADIWCDAAGATVYGLLVNYSDQTLWYGSATSDIPVAGTGLKFHSQAGVASSTGTAYQHRLGALYLRSGA